MVRSLKRRTYRDGRTSQQTRSEGECMSQSSHRYSIPHSVPTSCTVHRLVHTPHSVPTSCTVHRLVHTPHSVPTSCTVHRLLHTPHSVPISCTMQELIHSLMVSASETRLLSMFCCFHAALVTLLLWLSMEVFISIFSTVTRRKDPSLPSGCLVHSMQ